VSGLLPPGDRTDDLKYRVRRQMGRAEKQNRQGDDAYDSLGPCDSSGCPRGRRFREYLMQTVENRRADGIADPIIIHNGATVRAEALAGSSRTGARRLRRRC